MDSNANLAEQRLIQDRIDTARASQADYERLADLAKKMDNWLSQGGWLPSGWDLPQRRSE